ncbi:60S ribosomal protein, putative [Babesia ovata]|uniref:60S ribosomal protein, putative n=1 Tax=Babesia ovata TaxID=189622 RepID=A0A2H6KCA0_9APIC|nr:60S ribosomal protein, putative [Babesia ovata]GBE60612.1 60S ribosomal protein, putative [Babesia ovata]
MGAKMEDLKDGITKKETLLKGHRFHLRKRSDIAKEIARSKLFGQKSRTKKDANAILSLNVIFKQSKQKSLDVKRTSAICKKNKTHRRHPYKLLLAVRNRRNVQPSISESFLRDMGLSSMGTARFFSNSESSLKSLERVRPFVYYGTPTQRHVRELLNKR